MSTHTFAPSQSPFQFQLLNLPKNSTIAVIGAGAFGGWSALYLLRAGYKVMLIDAWGGGNSRSSSGDETRVIRSVYGSNEFYFDLNVRALELWKENEKRWGKKLFYNAGAIWFCYEEKTPLVEDAIPYAQKHRMELERLNLEEVKKRYPLVNVSDLHHAYFDPHAGYLKARESMQAVQEAFIQEGGTFIQSTVKPGKINAGKIESVDLINGSKEAADVYLFACGPWLGKLFPEVLGNVITCSKQEAYYFGTPADKSQSFDKMPVWIDVDGKDFYYGIPGNANRGFKIGVDIRGEEFDPTNGERIMNADTFAKAKKFITHRFPDLKNAPLLESRVCPYENSPDGNFIFQQHPEASNVLLLGGGSGHGFKHGPALGELVTNSIKGQ